MGTMGRKVTFHLTMANEEKEKKIREKWELEGGRITTAFVINKALALLFEKEFAPNRTEQ